MDLIGEYILIVFFRRDTPFIVVGTCYFTKWVEARPVINVGQNEIIIFLQHHIVYIFGIPKIIATTHGIMFTSVMVALSQWFGIKLIHSFPFYA